MFSKLFFHGTNHKLEEQEELQQKSGSRHFFNGVNTTSHLQHWKIGREWGAKQFLAHFQRQDAGSETLYRCFTTA